MLPTRFHRFRDPAAAAIGLAELRSKGLTPRGMLFLALDGPGEIYVAIPDDMNEVTKVRVGDKLTLKPPWEGRYYHFDSIHRLPGGAVLWNGDRRLAQPGDMTELVFGLSEWIKGYGAKNVFLGCTPHQPGAWWAFDDRAPAVALHEVGFVDVLTSPTGLLARRIGYPQLFYLRHGAVNPASPGDAWIPVFQSDLGNILLLERRLLADRLVLSCERGLVEVSLSTLPGPVAETGRIESKGGVGVLGRVDAGAFAVTSGKVQPWGLAELQPATLVGGASHTLQDVAMWMGQQGGGAA